MNKIKERLTIVGLIAFAIGVFYILFSTFASFGSEAAETEGAEEAWGFQWAANNLGWITLIIIVICLLVYMMWVIYKRRRS